MGIKAWLQCIVVACVVVGMCSGHARLIDPPSRASAWRFGFDTPIDYNDNEGSCGGFNHQYAVNDGKCGLCGDAWEEDPRPHEAGGLYATGTIVKEYTQGEVISVTVEVTSNHQGHFEFRICPNNNPDVEATQTCLNMHPLYQEAGGFEYWLPTTRTGNFVVNLNLPLDLTCTQCVLQWRYVAGNNWGICENGTGMVGCGPQEEFRACADVAISSQLTGSSQTTRPPSSVLTPHPTTASPVSSTAPPTTASPVSSTAPPTTASPVSSTAPPTIASPVSSTAPPTIASPVSSTAPPTTASPVSSTAPPTTGNCRAVGVWQSILGMDVWCMDSCNHVPSYCPPSHCKCA